VGLSGEGAAEAEDAMQIGHWRVALEPGETGPAAVPAGTESGPRGSLVEIQAAASLRGHGGDRSNVNDFGVIPEMAVWLKQSSCSERRKMPASGVRRHPRPVGYRNEGINVTGCKTTHVPRHWGCIIVVVRWEKGEGEGYLGKKLART